jgi:hypothetical protein
MITMDQLAEVTRAQARGDSRNIGDMLVEGGLISSDQLAELVSAQKLLIAKHRASKPAQPARSEPQASGVPRDEPAEQAPRSSARSEAQPSEAPAAAAPCAPVEVVAEIPDAADRAELDRVLRDAVQCGASDIHLHSGDAVRMRIGGCIAEEATPLPAGSSLEKLALAGLSAAERAEFAERGEIDFRYMRSTAYRASAPTPTGSSAASTPSSAPSRWRRRRSRTSACRDPSRASRATTRAWCW